MKEREREVSTKRFSPPISRGGKSYILRVGTSLAAQREIPPHLFFFGGGGGLQL